MGILDRYILDQYYKRPNRVKNFQKTYQKGNALVFLKGPSDLMLYRTAMGLSIVGLCISFGGLYLMATGRIRKKQR